MDRQRYAWFERIVTGLGYEFVHLEWVGRSGLVRVYVDGPSGIGLDDCATVSEHLSRAMTVEGIAYERLEVSSPGLDRPLAKLEDFSRFRGHKARVVLRLPRNGRKNYTGVIAAVENGSVHLETESGPVVLEYDDIDKARLVPKL